MENIYKSIGLLCLEAYITGIMFSVAPNGSTQKSVKLICSLYIIIAVFSPLKNISFEAADLRDYRAETSIDAEQYIIQQAAANIEKLITDRLNKENISYGQVKVHINKQTEGLSVAGIELHGIKESNKNIIIVLLKDITTKENIKFGV